MFRIAWIVACVGVLLLPFAAAAQTGAEPAPPPETHPGIETRTESFAAGDGTRLNAIVTRPAQVSGKLPAILFVPWLSCNSVRLPESGGDGWDAMMRRLVRESGALVWRTDKRGVGGSEGRCDTLDYDTELADHRAALQALRRRPDVDAARIVVFGASMGSNYAPLLAQDEAVAGVMVWGGGALTWAERMLGFERNALELGDGPREALSREVTWRYRFFDQYLVQGQTPAQITAAEPSLGAVWQRLVGTAGELHYGRPLAFHQQAQRQDWAAAWQRIEQPVLAMYGEFDWFEDPRGVDLIGRLVNERHPGHARVLRFAGLDHHFSRYASARAAFREKDGQIAADAVVDAMLAWLRERWKRDA